MMKEQHTADSHASMCLVRQGSQMVGFKRHQVVEEKLVHCKFYGLARINCFWGPCGWIWSIWRHSPQPEGVIRRLILYGVEEREIKSMKTKVRMFDAVSAVPHSSSTVHSLSVPATILSWPQLLALCVGASSELVRSSGRTLEMRIGGSMAMAKGTRR